MEKLINPTRRDFLKYSGGLVAWTGLSLGFPRLSFATLPTDNRFVLVILRGALDGMAAIPPYGDRDYAAMRGSLAFHPPGGEDGLIDLNGFFGLSPALEPLQAFYMKKQLAFIHATATPYRERSHFDAQNLLENGSIHAGGSEGWLNRVLGILNARPGNAIALSQQVPLVLQGIVPVSSWAAKSVQWNEGSDYMQKMKSLYSQNKQLSSAFSEGVLAQEVASSGTLGEDTKAGGKANGAAKLYAAAKAAALFLKKDEGARVAVLEAAGWDTHAGQGTSHGQLANRLADLAHGLAALPEALGTELWNKTIVVVVTEFGRTVHINGTGGTDHGTGSAAFVMGGAVNGGQVLGQWPGLAEGRLYQGRDLMPTTDMRSIFKTVLYSHLRVQSDALDNVVFPDSGTVPYMRGLLA